MCHVTVITGRWRFLVVSHSRLPYINDGIRSSTKCVCVLSRRCESAQVGENEKKAILCEVVFGHINFWI